MLKTRLHNVAAHLQDGVSLVETLVAISLFSIIMTAVTSMLIMSMRSQQEVNAHFRSQLDAKVVLYDMEKNIAEAKRKDTSDNQPLFQDDLISFPSQAGTNWITYTYATPPGAESPTIVRINTNTRPTSFIVQSTDKQMINVNPGSDLVTTVERVPPGAPIFTYYGADGSLITAPVATPRNVRSVRIAFATFVSDGHAQRESVVSSTQINLRNF
jgi:prepilin-type N-terminal cleavage/methylation domain-containing protein